MGGRSCCRLLLPADAPLPTPSKRLPSPRCLLASPPLPQGNLSISDFQVYARETNAAAYKPVTSDGGGASLGTLVDASPATCAILNDDPDHSGRGERAALAWETVWELGPGPGGQGWHTRLLILSLIAPRRPPPTAPLPPQPWPRWTWGIRAWWAR